MLRVLVPAALALLAASAGLSWRLDRMAKEDGSARWNVPREDVAKAVATGYDVLLADAFWIKFLQYNGDKLTEAPETRRYEHLWEGFRLITGLDPKFQDAYIFGSWVLGDAGESDHAADLVKLAAQRNPDAPWYPYQQGFIEMLYRHDRAAAIGAFGRAAELFSRPPANLKMRIKAEKMAAYLGEQHDQIDMAKNAWLDIRRTSARLGDKRMVAIAENALRRLGVTQLPEIR